MWGIVAPWTTASHETNVPARYHDTGSPARILTSSSHSSLLSGPSVAYFREGTMGRPTISSRLYPTRNLHSCVPNREEFIWDTVIVQAVKSLIRGNTEQNTLLKKRATWTEQDLSLAGMGVLQFCFLVIYSLAPPQGRELSEEGVHFSWKPTFSRTQSFTCRCIKYKNIERG